MDIPILNQMLVKIFDETHPLCLHCGVQLELSEWIDPHGGDECRKCRTEAKKVLADILGPEWKGSSDNRA